MDSLIYFITSKHIFKNNQSGNNSGTHLIDSFNIYSHYSDPFNYLTIPSNLTLDSNKMNEGLKNADIFCYEVINSVKNFKLQALEISDLENDFESDK